MISTGRTFLGRKVLGRKVHAGHLVLLAVLLLVAGPAIASIVTNPNPGDLQATVTGTVTMGAGSALIGGVNVVDSAGTNKAAVSAAGAVKVDGSAVTQPVSAASLPLPTGAATAAKQPALGTAGAASTDVLSVQGIAAMTPLKVDGSAVTQPISAASLPLPTGAALDSSVTAMSGKLPATIGQKASAASLAVVLASDQGAVPVTLPSLVAGTAAIGHLDSTSTADTDANNNSVVSVVSTAGGTAVLSARAARRAAQLCNVGTVVVLCSVGGTPTATSFGFPLKKDSVGGTTPAGDGGCSGISQWSGGITCIAASGTGSVSVVAQ